MSEGEKSGVSFAGLFTEAVVSFMIGDTSPQKKDQESLIHGQMKR
jgi:hypothetical protein